MERMITPSDINVLIACEESQAECKAFRSMGFRAFSCDVQQAHGGHPEWHIFGDVTPYLQGRTQFTTENGDTYSLGEWHMIIAHPPCTYLCKVGAVHLVKNGQIDADRYQKLLDARAFFFECLSANALCVAVENPLPMRRARLPQPSCFVHPSWYGVKYTKKTLYWLRNLPPLMAEIDYPDAKCFVRASRGKYRSRTFPQVAAAIAKQWGAYVLQLLNND